MATFWRYLDSYPAVFGDAFVVGFLVMLATVAALVAIIGSADVGRPRCRCCQRDACDYAWLDEKRCACGNDLARRGSVRVTRVRGRTSRIVVLVATSLAVALASVSVYLVSTGSSWTALLPLRVLTAGVDASSSQAVEAMRSFLTTADPAAARDAIASLHTTPGARIVDPLAHEALLGRLFDRSSFHQCETDACAQAQAWAIGELCDLTSRIEFPSGGRSSLQLRVQFRTAVQDSLLARVRELREGDVTIWSASTASDTVTKADDWRAISPDDAAPILDVPFDKNVPTNLTAVVELVRLPLHADAVASALDAGVVTGEELIDSLNPQRHVVSLAATPWWPVTGIRRVVPTAATSFAPRPPVLVRYAAAPFLAAALGGIAGGALLAMFLLFCVASTRRWFVLVAPECRRCRSQLRSHGDSVPDRCPECGAMLGGSTSVRWARRRPSLVAVLCTVPVLLGIGSALSIGAGVAVGSRSLPAVSRVLADPQRFTDATIDDALSDDPTRRVAATVRLSEAARDGTFSALPEYEVFDPQGTLRALASSLLRVLDEMPGAPPRDRMTQSALMEAVAAVAKAEMVSALDRARLLGRVSDPPIAIALTAGQPSQGVSIAVGTNRFIGAGPQQIQIWSPRTATEDAQWVSNANLHRVIEPLSSSSGLSEVELVTRRDVVRDDHVDPRLDPPTTDGPTPRGLVETIVVPVLTLPDDDHSPVADEVLRAIDPLVPFLSTASITVRPVGAFNEVRLDVSERTGRGHVRELRRRWEIWDGTTWRHLPGGTLLRRASTNDVAGAVRVRHVAVSDEVKPDRPLEALFALLSEAPPREYRFERCGTRRLPDGTIMMEYRPFTRPLH